MKTPILMLAIFALGSGALPAPSHARQPREGMSVSTSATRLEGLTRESADDLIDKLEKAQRDLRQGDGLYFELLSGAPASYREAKVSPRDAFLDISFARPFSIKKLPSDNPSWNPYRMEILPNGPGRIVCDVDVVLGFYGQIARVQMYYRPPHPF